MFSVEFIIDHCITSSFWMKLTRSFICDNINMYLLYLIHRVRGQHNRVRERAESDFRHGRDHDSIPDARREVCQQ